MKLSKSKQIVSQNNNIEKPTTGSPAMEGAINQQQLVHPTSKKPTKIVIGCFDAGSKADGTRRNKEHGAGKIYGY